MVVVTDSAFWSSGSHNEAGDAWRWSSSRLPDGSLSVKPVFREMENEERSQDLAALWEQVNAASPSLPDGRRFCFAVEDGAHPMLDRQKHRVA